MELIETPNIKVSPETNRKRHKRYKQVRTNFIISCGEKSIKNGYDIHHQIPLSMKEGTNSFDNLCIIPKSFHQYLNVMVYNPQINSNAKMCILPKFARVVDDEEKKQLFEYLERSR